MPGAVEAWVDAFKAAGFPLERDVVGSLLESAVDRVLAEDEILVKQGDAADSLFLVVDGKLAVSVEAGPHEAIRVDELGPFAIVGEIALLVGGQRSATVRALTRSTVKVITRERFDELTHERPLITDAFARALQTRLQRVKVAAHLRELLGEIDPNTLRQIEERIRWVHLAGGEELFRQGDPPSGAYIVMVGRLRVAARGDDGEEREIDEVGPGEWVGEMGLLTSSPRSATVFAIRDTELVWLSPEVFEELVCRDPKALLQTSRSIVTRLQRQMAYAGSPRKPRARTFALVPIDPGVDTEWLGKELARALGGFGSLLHLTAAQVDTALGKPAISQSSPGEPGQLRVNDWLMDQERLFETILFHADSRCSEWTKRVLGHADHILLVGRGSGSPALGEVDEWVGRRSNVAGRKPQQSLILLQQTTEPAFAGTVKWLTERALDAHYHVRVGQRAAVERLARHLTGNAISLVYGGGASRGYAHIGVRRVFEDLGIPVDAACGTSIGSFIAAVTAGEFTTNEMLEIVPPIMQKAFFDPTLPLVSLMSGKNITEAAMSDLGRFCIEDLPLPMFCVSTSLTHGGEYVHRRGPVGVAMRSSGSVPGILPPVPCGDQLLIDGGLSNNVPVDLANAIFGGNVIAVDVVPEFEMVAPPDSPLSVSGFGFLWSHINPFSKKSGMPNIASILFRTMTTSTQGLRRAKELSKLSALYLRPQVSRWNMMDFRAAEPIALEGERGTRAPIQAWWEREKAALVPWT